MRELSVIGGGSWGTALAIVLAPRAARIRLWVYEKDLAAEMQAKRENSVYLPGFRLPPNVEVVNELGAALDGTEVVLSVMPSHLVRCRLPADAAAPASPPCSSSARPRDWRTALYYECRK